jgi:hypothetical protein
MCIVPYSAGVVIGGGETTGGFCPPAMINKFTVVSRGVTIHATALL